MDVDDAWVTGARVRMIRRRRGLSQEVVAGFAGGFDAARLAQRPDLVGMLAMSRTVALMRLGARRRASALCADVLNETIDMARALTR